MNYLDNVGQFLVGRITFPLSSYLYNRRHILRNLKLLQKSEYFPEALLRELQFKKLTGVIAHACEYVPFYKKRFKEIGFLPGDLRCLEDLKRIPPVSRQDVIDYHMEMVDVRRQASIA